MRVCVDGCVGVWVSYNWQILSDASVNVYRRYNVSLFFRIISRSVWKYFLKFVFPFPFSIDAINPQKKIFPRRLLINGSKALYCSVNGLLWMGHCTQSKFHQTQDIYGDVYMVSSHLSVDVWLHVLCLWVKFCKNWRGLVPGPRSLTLVLNWIFMNFIFFSSRGHNEPFSDHHYYFWVFIPFLC